VTFLNSQREKLAGAALPSDVAEVDTAQLKRAIGESFVAGFRWIMLLGAGLALLSALAALLLLDKSNLSARGKGAENTAEKQRK